MKRKDKKNWCRLVQVTSLKEVERLGEETVESIVLSKHYVWGAHAWERFDNTTYDCFLLQKEPGTYRLVATKCPPRAPMSVLGVCNISFAMDTYPREATTMYLRTLSDILDLLCDAIVSFHSRSRDLLAKGDPVWITEANSIRNFRLADSNWYVAEIGEEQVGLTRYPYDDEPAEEWVHRKHVLPYGAMAPGMARGLTNLVKNELLRRLREDADPREHAEVHGACARNLAALFIYTAFNLHKGVPPQHLLGRLEDDLMRFVTDESY